MTPLEVQDSLKDAISWLAYRLQKPWEPEKPAAKPFWSRLSSFFSSPSYPERFWSREFDIHPPVKFSIDDHPIVKRLDELIQKRRDCLKRQNIPFPERG